MARNYPPLKFYFQMGNDDRPRAMELLQKDIGDGAFISRRHEAVDKIPQLVAEIRGLGKEAFFDPQLYNPRYIHDGEREDYGPDTATQIATERFKSASLNKELDFQQNLALNATVVPAPFIEQVSAEQRGFLRSLIGLALDWKVRTGSDRPLLLSLPLAASVLTHKESWLPLLDSITGTDIDGFYIVCESPDEGVLPGHTDYLIGLMEICFRLKANGYKVIVGYSSYQAMLLFPLGIDGFCSGSFQNRKAFGIDEWEQEEKGVRRQSTKFWALDLLSPLTYPDEAELLFARGRWTGLSHGEFSASLFDGSSPATKAATWKLRASYMHYLQSCARLCTDFANLGRAERVERVLHRVREASRLHQQVSNDGVNLRPENQGKHLPVWEAAFRQFVDQVKDDLEDEFR